MLVALLLLANAVVSQAGNQVELSSLLGDTVQSQAAESLLDEVESASSLWKKYQLAICQEVSKACPVEATLLAQLRRDVYRNGVARIEHEGAVIDCCVKSGVVYINLDRRLTKYLSGSSVQSQYLIEMIAKPLLLCRESRNVGSNEALAWMECEGVKDGGTVKFVVARQFRLLAGDNGELIWQSTWTSVIEKE